MSLASFSKYFGSSRQNIPSEQPVDMSKFQNLTEISKDYKFVPETAPRGDESTIIPVSPTAKFRNLSTGGQYTVDFGKETPYKSYAPYDQYKTLELRGGMPSSLFQIDHKIPLWAGGTDNSENKVKLSISQHERKTKIEAITRTLYYNKNISMAQARVMNLNAMERPDLDLDEVELDAEGNLAVGSEDPQKAVALAVKKKMEWDKPYTPKIGFAEVWDEIKNTSILGRFAKSAISGLTGGWISPERTEPIQGRELEASITEASGQIAGTIASFVAIGGLASQTLGRLGILKGAATLLQKNKYLKGSKAVIETAVGKEKVKVAIPIGMKAIHNAALFTAYGQLSKQENDEISTRIDRFFSDAAFGAMVAVPGNTLKSYAGLFAGTYTLSTLEGATQKEALINSAIMVGFHRLGQGSRIKEVDNLASKASVDYVNSYIVTAGKKLRTFDPLKPYTAAEIDEACKEAFNNIKQVLKIDPNCPPEIIEKEIAKIVVSGRQLIKGGLGEKKKILEDIYDVKSVVKNSKDIKIAEERLKSTPKELDDIIYKDIDKIVATAKGELDAAQKEFLNKFEKELLTGEIKITGTANEMDGKVIKEMVNRGVKGGDTVIIQSRKDMESLMKFKNEGKNLLEKTDYPKQNLQISIITSDGKILRGSYIPSEKRIDILPFNINETSREVAEALSAKTGKKIEPFLYDPKLNKDTISQLMDKFGLPYLTAKITFITNKAKISEQPALGIEITKESYATAKRGSKVAKSELSKTATKVISEKFTDKSKGMNYFTGPLLKLQEAIINKDLKQFKDTFKGIFAFDISEEAAKNIVKNKKSTVGDILNVVESEKINKGFNKDSQNIYDLMMPWFDSLSSYEKEAVRRLKNIGNPIEQEVIKKALEKKGELPAKEKTIVQKALDKKDALKEELNKPLESVLAQTSTKKTPKRNIPEKQKITKEEIEKKELLVERRDEQKTSAKEKREERPKWRDAVSLRKGEEGINKAAIKYLGNNLAAAKDFTGKNLLKLAKKVSNNGEDIFNGWKNFLYSIENKIQKAIEDPSFRITNKKELNDLKWKYQHLANSFKRKEFVGGDKEPYKEGPTGNIGKADRDLMEYNKKNGTEIELLELNKNIDFGVIQDSREKFNEVMNRILNANPNIRYLPVGIVAKGVKNIRFIKFDKKVVKNFDEKRHLQKGEKLSSLSNDDKFLRVMMVDALGLSKETSHIDFVKRSKEIYNRYDKFVGENEKEKITLDIIPSKKIKDIKNEKGEKEINISSDMFINPNDSIVPKSIESFSNGFSFDGKLIIGKDLFPKLIKGFNYDPNKFINSYKLLINADVIIDGVKTRVTHKVHAYKQDGALTKYVKDTFGTRINSHGLTSFSTNAKFGPKEGSLSITFGDIYAKPLSVSKSGKIKTSAEVKFVSKDSGVKNDMLNKKVERMHDLEDFNEKILKSKNKEEFESVLDEYAEKYKLDKDSLFYGTLGESFDLGAAKINLAHELERITKNLFFETVYVDNLPNSSRVFISPNLKLDYDGNGKLRYSNNKEIVLGKEQMGDINVKEGDFVLVSRDPSIDINNVLILKVVDGSKLGHTSLGRENGSVSLFNERIILGGDQDADTMLIAKVGDGGVPESYAKAIQERGATAIPFTEVTPTPPKPVTVNNIIETINNQLVGDDQTSKIATVSRIMNSIVDNKITIKVHSATKDSNGKSYSRYEILSNGQIVGKGSTSPSKKGFLSVAEWGENEKKMRNQALIEAIDSKKSEDIIETSNNNDPNWMLRQIFRNEDGKRLDDYQANALSKAMKDLQRPYNIDKIVENSKDLDSVLRVLSPTFEIWRKIKKTGASLTPWQESLLSISRIKTFKISDITRLEADKLGGEMVKKNIKNIDLNLPAVKELRSVVLKAKKEYHMKDPKTKKKPSKVEKRIILQRVNDFFQNNFDKGEYTNKDLDSMSYWAATSWEANMAHGFMDSGAPFETSFYVNRLRDIINSSPRIAKEYYKASESLDISNIKNTTKTSSEYFDDVKKEDVLSQEDDSYYDFLAGEESKIPTKKEKNLELSILNGYDPLIKTIKKNTNKK